MGFDLENSAVYRLFSLGVFLTLASCASSNTSSPSTLSSYREVQTVAADRHVLIGFTLIEGNEPDSAFIQFIRVNPGKIVEENYDFDLETGDLRVVISNSSGEEIKSANVRNPLRRIIEGFSESGELESTVVEEDVADSFVRFNYTSGMEIVRLFRMQDSGTMRLLLTKPILE